MVVEYYHTIKKKNVSKKYLEGQKYLWYNIK